MSKKFLHEIKKMTKKGVYPSLSILLEDDLFDMPETEKSNDDEKPEAKDDGESEPESKPESKDDGEKPETESVDDGESDEEEPKPETDDDEANQMKTAIEVEEINNAIKTLQFQSPARRLAQTYLPNSSMGSIFDNKSYNLKNFVLLGESAKELESSLDDIQKVLVGRDEEIRNLKLSAEKIKSGDPNFISQIPELVLNAVEKTKRFDSHYDKASVVASDFFNSIKEGSIPEDLEENIKEFIYQFSDALNKKGIQHAINVNNIEPTKYNNAKGSKSPS